VCTANITIWEGVVRRLKRKTPCASVWKYVSLIAVLVLFSFFPTTLASLENPGISSYGIIQYPNFVYPGTTTSIKVFYQRYIDYKLHAFEIIKDLNIDTIRVYGAGFEEFNMKYSNWAEKLSSFLDLCENHGVKVVFHHIADWRYGCTDDHPHVKVGSSKPNPWPFGIEVYDGIDASKAKIDMLAGDNNLGHDFLNDPRIPFWILLNEPFFDVSTGTTLVLDWVREIATYMRSKGAKVTVGFGSVNHGDAAPSKWVPLIRDYVDFVIFHWYGGKIAVDAQNAGESETGMRRDKGGTEETRGKYYRAIFKASLDARIGGVFPFILFDVYLEDSTISTYGAVYVDETYFTHVTDQYKTYYSTS